MAAATPLVTTPKSQQALIAFERACYTMLNTQWNIRENLRQRDLAYMRENDWTVENWRARISNRLGDPNKFRNVVVPIIYPQVESAVTYQASVFLTGVPIFGWSAAPGQEIQALAFQAITEENQVRGGWIDEYMMAFRDGFKYNLGITCVTWDRILTWVTETDPTFTAGKQGKPKQVIWEGNCIKRWDPYNSFWDTRVHPTELYKSGEFAGTTEIMSRIKLKMFLAQLPDGMVSNYKLAFESGLGLGGIGSGGIESFYIPQINPEALMRLDARYTFDWMAWAALSGINTSENSIQYKNVYEVTTLFARILPIDFDLNVPSKSTVQIWKLITVNHQVLVYAERQTNVHANLPVMIMQPNHDGLAYQTKSLAENAQPFQDIASALVNSAMAARRRAVGDRAIYNPSLISEAHINSDSPTAKIPIRPSAYGKPINEAYYQIPYRDDQSAVAFQELPQMMAMANQVNGQNPAKQGQFVKGNKTLHEYSDVMQNANGRDQMTSMGIEVQMMTPTKEIIKANILQYQASGQIYSTSLQQSVPIDPIALRMAMVGYKISDGLIPTDKVISADEFAVALQTLSSSPTLAAGYNLAPAFSYLMQTRNVDLSPFEKSLQQVAYEQAVQQWMELATQAMKQGTTFNTPQPTPAQYGYVPGAPNNKQGTPSGSPLGLNPQQAAAQIQTQQTQAPQTNPTQSTPANLSQVANSRVSQ